MSRSRCPSIRLSSVFVASALSEAWVASTSSGRATWYIVSMSPVPRASDARREGAGSPVTTTMWGVRPLRLRIRFSASERAFWARSERRVHLHETTACTIEEDWLRASNGEYWAALPTAIPASSSSRFVIGERTRRTSGEMS